MDFVSNDPPGVPVPVLPVLARPPVLGAIAISGIVIGTLSVLASLLSAGYAASLYLASESTRRAILRNAPAALPVSRPKQPVLLAAPLVTPVGQRGLESSQRAAVIESLGRKIQMTPQQVSQFDALLALDGQEVFGVSNGQSVTGDAALQAIGDRFGPLPSATTDEGEPFFFETDAGRAEVYSDRALFHPKNRLSYVRASAGRRMVEGHPVLLPEDIDMIVELARQAGGAGLNAAQVQTLRELLSDPRQKLVALNPRPEGTTIGLQSAVVRPDGYASVYFAGGPVFLSPRGEVILSGDPSAVPGVNITACALVVVEAGLSMALGVFLVMVAVRLLRRPRQRLRPFMFYTLAKIVLAIAGGLAIGWITTSFVDRVPGKARIPVTATQAGLALGVSAALLGCIYPLALLIAARTRNVRVYYHPTE